MKKQKREKLSDVKREREAWRMLAHVQILAMAAVARDKDYGCRCGEEPYTDGAACPPCFAMMAHEQMNKLRSAWGLKLTKKRKLPYHLRKMGRKADHS